MLFSANVNKFATLRNSRGHNSPNVSAVVQDLLVWGVRGITVHPRPDERHIKPQDVQDIHQIIQKFNQSTQAKVEFNIEGYPSPDFLKMAEEINPDQITLVPDPPEALTSNAGWEFEKNLSLLQKVCSYWKTKTSRVSLFLDPLTYSKKEHQALEKISPERVELYTEQYAKDFKTKKYQTTLQTYQSVAQEISLLKIGINAGHDLNQENLVPLKTAIPQILEVSIGHAFVCEALYQGLEQTTKNYLSLAQEVTLN